MRTLLRRTLLIAGILVLGALSGNPVQAANGLVTYTYDALGRLASASYDTGVVILYTYDANGNRTEQKINVIATSGNWNGFNWGEALWNE